MTSTTAPAAAAPPDERLARVGVVVRLLRRPEFGALLGAIVVFALFAGVDKTANGAFLTAGGTAAWANDAMTVGIVAVAVALLMIGGEFDLSAGVMVGSSGLLLGLLVTRVGLGVWPAIVVTFAFAAVIGAVNGWLVVSTRLPSFIVTLATFFVLRGLNVAVPKEVTGTVRVSGIDTAAEQDWGYRTAQALFAGSVNVLGAQFKVGVLWWLALTVVATWILTRTRFGNWIFAVGGDANAARNTGVPVTRTKIALFIGTSLAAALYGVMVALGSTSVQSNQGVGQEFIYIIAAVVGGCLLTGGFGSAIGASIGAAIIGMAFIGITYARWDSDLRFTFLGVILFLAVMVNTVISRRASGGKR